MPGAYLYGWDSANSIWVKCLVNAEGKLIIDPTEIFENTPTDNEHGKAPDSDWAHDHVADSNAHHAQLHKASHEDGGGDPISTLGGNVAFPDRSMFFAYLSSDQDLTAGELTTVPFDTVEFDKQSEFDTSNHYFKAKVAGVYYLFAALRTANFADNDWLSLSMYKNGSTHVLLHNQIPGSNIRQGLFAGIVLNLNVDDTIEVKAEDCDTNFTITSFQYGTYFCGFRVA